MRPWREKGGDGQEGGRAPGVVDGHIFVVAGGQPLAGEAVVLHVVDGGQHDDAGEARAKEGRHARWPTDSLQRGCMVSTGDREHRFATSGACLSNSTLWSDGEECPGGRLQRC